VKVSCLSLCLAAALHSACGWGASVDLVGTVERKALELAAPTSEVIVEVPVEVGATVAARQVLVRLDPQVAEAELKAHAAALAAARAGLDAAERDFARVEGLRASRIASSSQLDEGRRQRDEAVALVAEREARVAQARKRLDDLSVRALEAGVLDQLPFEAGERVPAGGVVAVVLSAGKPWVRVWVPGRLVARAKLGGHATIRIEGLERDLSGHLEYLAREPEFTPHYALTERESAHLVYEARIVVDDGPADLRPGLAARVRLALRDGGA
jgi:HlyD family secretion protein